MDSDKVLLGALVNYAYFASLVRFQPDYYDVSDSKSVVTLLLVCMQNVVVDLLKLLSERKFRCLFVLLLLCHF